ncbi:helix-turn-helix domain-containing protein [Subtercola lobariae]|uniref:HTH cro/C1-type domain-containing protein n=1 Tax=Subtercola lobariae TaxID=1588641 RepID=A0A917BB80_9MICO|nr:helix-turn-helix transcriptional regulator [Subtercola lobariae]GGF32126.1 hypothetical protein GCM10011399_26600 [Subtercola lobariae]
MARIHSEAARILGERVKAARLRIGISQEDLGELADMHFSNIGKIERGNSNPNLATIVALAGPLGVDPGEWLAGLTPAMLPGRTHQVTAADLIAARAEGRS